MLDGILGRVGTYASRIQQDPENLTRLLRMVCVIQTGRYWHSHGGVNDS